jgi:hypothetical protein
MNPTPYEITVRGRLGDALIDAFAGLTAAPAGTNTVLRGRIDQAALHGVLERIESLGLELLDVHRR